MSGVEIAQKMLDDHGIKDVKITCTRGTLTDHYNPLSKTVNLSEDVYHKKSVAAVAVAAHECGHAVQHAKGYEWLQIRSKLVPMVNVSANLSQWLLMGGILLMYSSSFGYHIAIVGLLLYAITTLFTFITLPVEYDASNRALAWLKNRSIITHQEFKGVEDSLKWAARTYVVAALGALATLIYFAFRILGSRE
ncbi:peptidase membrane zinc metallopeptidase [Elysia marginata]|uniref:Peptidase membrane zinc metallopeptidase n=1 Tax=Elysia marginata TaxID=1093978 RepID=A0AAV4FX45_9GAST|nr:peptidase membrane zinc metallopeptidase [Elysia marginata]